MLEGVLIGRKKSRSTGPGPQQFKTPALSTLQEGYYGFVTAAELGLGTEIAAALGLTEGTVMNDSVGFYKFAWEGKTIFIAAKAFRYAISWKALYDVGAIFGDGTTGVVPSGVTPRNQDAVYAKGAWQFRVSVANHDSTNPKSTAPNGTAFMINRLMNRIQSTWSAATRWDTISSSNLTDQSLGYYDHTRTVNTNLTSIWANLRLAATSYGGIAVTGTNTIAGWRPVLELIE